MLEIGQYLFHWLRGNRWLFGQRRTNLPRRVARENGIALGMSEIISNPVDYLIAVAAKCLRLHIAKNTRLLCPIQWVEFLRHCACSFYYRITYHCPLA